MTNLNIRPVKITCKNCGSLAYADDFKLDNIKGILVCPYCSRIAKKESKKKESDKHKDWDEDDAYLERFYKRKIGDKEIKYERLEGSKYMLRYFCHKCKYSFKYNTLKQWPRHCPSCGIEIDIIKPV